MAPRRRDVQLCPVCDRERQIQDSGSLDLVSGVGEGLTFYDLLQTGSVATTVGGFIGSVNNGFAFRTFTDSLLRFGSNNQDVMFVSDENVTIDIAAADGEYLTFQSSGDVFHGFTTDTTASGFGNIRKCGATTGGLSLAGYTEATLGLMLNGLYTTGDTGKSTSASGAVMIHASKLSGTTAGAMGANDNILGPEK